MLITLFAILLLLSPLITFGIGYYIGRFGSPIVIKRQRRGDRRRQPDLTLIENGAETEVYRA